MKAPLVISNRGFTLIEIIVAVGILAIFIGIIYSTFFGTIRTIKRAEELTDSFQSARIILDKIAGDLKGAVHIINNPNYVFNGIDSYDGDPNRDRIDFITTANIITDSSTPQSDTTEVSYYIDRDHSSEGYLVRRTDIYPDKEPAKGGELKIIAKNITGINFQYFLIENKTDEAALSEQEKQEEQATIWDKIEDPDNWHDEWVWKDRQFMPIMVRIRLSLLDEANNETSFSTVAFINRDPDSYTAANPEPAQERAKDDILLPKEGDKKDREGPENPGSPYGPGGSDRPRIDKPILDQDPDKRKERN